MMRVLMSALQDSVTFLILLGVQVVIVSSLAITALWLYFKRLKNKTISESELETEEVIRVSDPQPLAEINEVHLSLIRDLEAKVSSLEKEKLELTQDSSHQTLEEERKKTEELKKLNEQTSLKIGELEGKLLEYEVIKHEIGQLNQLKLENENLKVIVANFEKPNTQAANETKTEPSIEAVQGDSFKPTSPMPEAGDPGIEGLLNEIEALTSEKKEPQRRKA